MEGLKLTVSTGVLGEGVGGSDLKIDGENLGPSRKFGDDLNSGTPGGGDEQDDGMDRGGDVDSSGERTTVVTPVDTTGNWELSHYTTRQAF